MRLLPDAPSRRERRAVALDHLRKCLGGARAFHDAIDLPADAPPGVNLQLFAGDRHPTPAVAAARGGRGTVEVLAYGPGDRRVLRSSAIMDEGGPHAGSPRLHTPIRWDGVTFIPADHMALTRHPTFINSTLFVLLEKPRPTCGYRRPWPGPPRGWPATAMVGA